MRVGNSFPPPCPERPLPEPVETDDIAGIGLFVLGLIVLVILLGRPLRPLIRQRPQQLRPCHRAVHKFLISRQDSRPHVAIFVDFRLPVLAPDIVDRLLDQFCSLAGIMESSRSDSPDSVRQTRWPGIAAL